MLSKDCGLSRVFLFDNYLYRFYEPCLRRIPVREGNKSGRGIGLQDRLGAAIVDRLVISIDSP